MIILGQNLISRCQEIDWLGMMGDTGLYSQPWGSRGKRVQSSSLTLCDSMFKKNLRGREGEREGGKRGEEGRETESQANTDWE